MRISKEISGNAEQRARGENQERVGRGEYEWCEPSETDPKNHEILNRKIYLVLPDGGTIDTGCIFGYQGDKYRIRIASDVEGRELHPIWHAAAVLMMPKPIRAEPRWGDGVPVMRTGQYGIIHLHLGQIDISAPGRACVAIKTVEAGNHYQQEQINFASRYEQVRQAWAGRSRFEKPIADLLHEHEIIFRSGQTDSGRRGQVVVRKLQRQVADRSADYSIPGNAPTTDVLPSLLQVLGGILAEPIQSLDAIPPEEVQVRRREVKEWKRWAAARGAASARFRREVRSLYNSTCIVCGLRLPSLGSGSNPGVDAAHILPWSEYEMDHVSNGICLCKLHHWAFDEAFIAIRHDAGRYYVEIPDQAEGRIASSNEKIDLGFLTPFIDQIPDIRLPRNPNQRPKPQFLDRLREAQS